MGVDSSWEMSYICRRKKRPPTLHSITPTKQITPSILQHNIPYEETQVYLHTYTFGILDCCYLYFFEKFFLETSCGICLDGMCHFVHHCVIFLSFVFCLGSKTIDA